jgi:hypothetical protein
MRIKIYNISRISFSKQISIRPQTPLVKLAFRLSSGIFSRVARVSLREMNDSPMDRLIQRNNNIDKDKGALSVSAHGLKQSRLIQSPERRPHQMQISLSPQPVVALIAGVLILFAPRLLNYIVAFYLIVFGILGSMIDTEGVRNEKREQDYLLFCL